MLVKVYAGSAIAKDFQRASISEIVEQLKFLSLNISSKDDLHFEWMNLTFNLEQTPILPKNPIKLLISFLCSASIFSLKFSNPTPLSEIMMYMCVLF